MKIPQLLLFSSWNPEWYCFSRVFRY